MLVRSSSDSDLAAVTGGYSGSLDVEAYEDDDDEEEDDDGGNTEDDRDDDDDDDDDDCMGIDHNRQEQLPYPGFVPISMKYLDQRSRPRNWCLAMITNPYPFQRPLKRRFTCIYLG